VDGKSNSFVGQDRLENNNDCALSVLEAEYNQSSEADDRPLWGGGGVGKEVVVVAALSFPGE